MYIFHIKRQQNKNTPPYYEDISYEGQAATVAQALKEINETKEEPIRWQHSCLVRKCGACAMRINGVPRLACATFLRDLKKKITLEPLGKFPVIADLIVDRSRIDEDLKKMKIWLEEKALPNAWTFENRYQSSRCLLCGCCLEVCPNYGPKTLFAGAAAAVNAYRIFAESRKTTAHYQAVQAAYKKSYYETCSQSLSCNEICPAKIPVTELLACANQFAR